MVVSNRVLNVNDAVLMARFLKLWFPNSRGGTGQATEREAGGRVTGDRRAVHAGSAAALCKGALCAAQFG